MKPYLNHFVEKYRKMTDSQFEKVMRKASDINPELLETLRRECTQRRMNHYFGKLDELEYDYAKKGFPQFFRDVNKTDIADNLNLLRSKLPKKCTKRNYQITFKQLKVKSSYDFRRDSMQNELQRIADLMRQHLMIWKPIKILAVSHVSAGKFEMIDGLNCIYINDDMSNHNFYQKVAILAHEMSHFYLMRMHNISKPVEKENELLTELNAVYVGFGLILLEGYKEHTEQYENYTRTSKMGYVDLKTVSEAIIQTAYLRKQKPQWIIKQVGWVDKPTYFFRLFKLIREFKKARRLRTQKV